MLHPLPGFATYPTRHCVTGSLKHVYDYHGFPVSEDLLLGLGRGLGFVYFHIKGADPFYGGRANAARPGEEGLEKTAGRRTGVAVESHATSSARTAQAALRELLLADEPVLVYLDMGFLPYFELPADYHFGGHVVVVAGYDPGTGQVLVADRDRELHPIGWDALERARGSQYKPFPPRHTWYTFDFAGVRPPTQVEVRESIGEVCHGMLAPPIANLGVTGIRKAIRETAKWPEVLDAGALRRTCLNVAMFIDRRGGTGGGIFRYMYARFLGEAAAITGETRLGAMAAELTVIGDRWEQVAAAFAAAAQADHPTDLLEAATKPMHDIADLEQAFWERLGTRIAALTPSRTTPATRSAICCCRPNPLSACWPGGTCSVRKRRHREILDGAVVRGAAVGSVPPALCSRPPRLSPRTNLVLCESVGGGLAIDGRAESIGIPAGSSPEQLRGPAAPSRHSSRVMRHPVSATAPSPGTSPSIKDASRPSPGISPSGRPGARLVTSQAEHPPYSCER